jgi:hypothetical protein
MNYGVMSITTTRCSSHIHKFTCVWGAWTQKFKEKQGPPVEVHSASQYKASISLCNKEDARKETENRSSSGKEHRTQM